MTNEHEIGTFENPCCRKHWEEKNSEKAVGHGDVLWNPIGMPFIVCKVCGNKRCPKATDCSFDCTNSNDSGQLGSIYGTTIEELTEIVRSVAENIDKSNENSIEECIKPLLEIGIKPNVHVGLKEEEFNNLTRIEWYAGQIINIVNKKSWFAVNSWLNCVDKFVPKIP